MSETYGTISSNIYPYNLPASDLTGDCINGLAIGVRLKIVVIADKATYNTALQTDFKSGDWDTNFIGTGNHYLGDLPTGSEALDLSKAIPVTIEDTATEYKITMEIDSYAGILDPTTFLVVVFRYSVGSTIEDIYYPISLNINLDTNNPVTNLRLVDATDTVITASQVCIGQVMKIKYDFDANWSYNYGAGTERLDTYANTNFTQQTTSLISEVATGEVDIDTSSAKDAFGVDIYALANTLGAGAACAASIDVDVVFTFVSFTSPNSAQVMLDFTIQSGLLATDIQEVVLTNNNFVVGSYGATMNYYGTLTGSLNSNNFFIPASSTPLPDGSTLVIPQSGSGIYTMTVTLTNGCRYSLLFIFDMAAPLTVGDTIANTQTLPNTF